MLLTISTTRSPATDLGYLLHKNPQRVQTFPLSFGQAHVFYSEATEARCTAALLLDVDPVALVRSNRGDQKGGHTLAQYVNDRPYVASSFLSVAIAQIYGSALGGRCKDKPTLPDIPLSLEVSVEVVPCRGGEDFLHRLFAPLGYQVTTKQHCLDDRFPEWGDSPYFSLHLSGTVRLSELLTHLYVLIPTLDSGKHYFIGDAEVEKLIAKGEGWLTSHPEKEIIVRRYLKNHHSLIREALAQLTKEDEPDADEVEALHNREEEAVERKFSLHDQRLGAVVAALKQCGAQSILDLGCGEGRLLGMLLKERQFTRLLGMDVSYRALEIAQDKLRLDRLPPMQRERISLIQGSLIYRDRRLEGYEAAAVVEVIEHLDPPRLAAFARVVFEFARPQTVIITTPNYEYNPKFETLPAGQFRHKDHRFEWTRAEFQAWSQGVCERFGYNVRFYLLAPRMPKSVRQARWRSLRKHSLSNIMNITIPELSLVVLIGASGSGKSTFARRHFLPTETLSSDFCRGLVSDDENSLAATNDAFEVLHFIAAKRLAAAKLTVVDATNVQAESRRPLVALARQYHCLPVAIVLDMPESVCQFRNQERPDRDFGPHVVRNHVRSLRQSLRGLEREGFRHVFVLSHPEQIETVTITREPLYNDKRGEHGPFDIIGDIHGCYDELIALLTKLGYTFDTTAKSDFESTVGTIIDTSIHVNVGDAEARVTVIPPPGRKALFLGDLCDRGPKTPGVLRLVMGMVAAGTALCVPGNHDIKLLRKLKGKDVQITHGLAESLQQLATEPPEFIAAVKKFLDALVSHYVLDEGKLVIAHAGLKAEMQGRGSGKVREFALYGETTGETDEFGLPIRYDWAAQYRGTATVVYGHTPIPTPEWLNHTLNIDTGCVFGGSLTALRWPERELVSVPALETYCEPMRPFLLTEEILNGDRNGNSDETQSGKSEGRRQGTPLTAQQQNDDVLDIEDVIGKRLVTTRLHGNITIREENAIAALEVMSRFAANPKWLIYLPPTMSPSETTTEEGLLEHPAEAFAYYRNQGVPTVVCEEKHMGSRTVVIVCRDEAVARQRFGVEDEGIGICVTRTGRRFFDSKEMEQALLAIIRAAMTASGLWETLATDWICLDCELMPWSAKAQELLRQQYAAVGAAANASLSVVSALLEQAAARSEEAVPLRDRYAARQTMAGQFVAAYRRYCWPVHSLSDLKLAPFHILATEKGTHTSENHLWHMETLAKLCAASDEGVLLATPYKTIQVTEPDSLATGIAWWETLTGQGGEGMVVKPLEFIAKGTRGMAQPAIKCRGREYLRIIYGPEYTAPENLERLRSRGLSGKRSLALREFALGIEGLERFVRHEPLRRVHECVFGVLALESEPVDPRL